MNKTRRRLQKARKARRLNSLVVWLSVRGGPMEPHRFPTARHARRFIDKHFGASPHPRWASAAAP